MGEKEAVRTERKKDRKECFLQRRGLDEETIFPEPLSHFPLKRKGA